MTEGTKLASFRIQGAGVDGDVELLVGALDQLSKNVVWCGCGHGRGRRSRRGRASGAVDVGSGTGEEVQAVALAVGPDR